PGFVFPAVEDEPLVALDAEEVIPPQILIAQEEPRAADDRVGIVAAGLGEGVELPDARLHRVVAPQRLSGDEAAIALVDVLQHLDLAVAHDAVAARHPPPRRSRQAVRPAA